MSNYCHYILFSHLYSIRQYLITLISKYKDLREIDNGNFRKTFTDV